MTVSHNTNELQAKIRACQVCDNLPLGPRPIVQFSGTSKLLIVGQAPGRITHEKGIPFDDPSGDRLRTWLGLERQDFYDAKKVAIVPMGFCFPGNGKSGDLPPRAECAPLWRSNILSSLRSAELTLIIGRYALDWHLPDFSKLTVTGTVKLGQEVWPQQLILPHPSPRNNRWLKQNPWFEKNVVPTLQERVGEMF